MHCLAGLDTPTAGQVLSATPSSTALSDTALTRLRRDQVGFVFQSFNLLPTLTAAGEHHAARSTSPAAPPTRPGSTRSSTPSACAPARPPPRRAVRRPAAAGRLRPGAGSAPGGDLRREPTGNLDSRTAADLLALLRRCVHELGQTIVMVTHDPVAAALRRPGGVPRRRPHRRGPAPPNGRHRARADDQRRAGRGTGSGCRGCRGEGLNRRCTESACAGLPRTRPAWPCC